ncbi:hypothetical protein ACN6LK_004769 [Streptomyces griseus]|uniref:hypothetical protein n=1 Tax=Streptomyces griseus TaxID=1911 RepID=UPI00403C3743
MLDDEWQQVVHPVRGGPGEPACPPAEATADRDPSADLAGIAACPSGRLVDCAVALRQRGGVAPRRPLVSPQSDQPEQVLVLAVHGDRHVVRGRGLLSSRETVEAAGEPAEATVEDIPELADDGDRLPQCRDRIGCPGPGG